MRRALILGFICAFAACYGARLSADQAESVQSLRDDKLKAAQEWWDVVAERDKVASPPATPAAEFAAARAVKDAQLDVLTDKQERLRALTVYRDRMQLVYDKISVLSQAASAGGEAERVAEARIHLLEAKIWLKEEEKGQKLGRLIGN
ncbi:MAG TPA: hypothetical protein VGY55_25435 [Pirellulales bacterium]|jgi:hypothetical protein|nr:hypothetical protein [Pirellulales bacterium]